MSEDYKNSFQYQDIMNGLNQNRYLYKLDTGMGKSYILCALLTHLRYYGEINKCIIVTSSIGVMNLADELKKFIVDYDESRTLVIKSISKVKDRAIFNDNYDILICGYDTLNYIDKYYWKKAHTRIPTRGPNKGKEVCPEPPKHPDKLSIPLAEWFGDKKGCIFLDECHLLGHSDSQRSNAIMNCMPFIEYRYLFSATPCDKIPNFYSILKILDNGLVGGQNKTEWLANYYHVGTPYNPYAIDFDSLNTEKWMQLQEALYRDYGVSRDKSILNLPDAIEMPIINIDMSPKHRAIYEALVNGTLENAAGDKGMVLGSFPTIECSIDNPKSLLNSVKWDSFDSTLQSMVNSFDFEKDCSKIDALNHIIDYECNEMGNKIIVFYYHPATCENLKKIYGDKADYMASSLNDEERDAVKKAFKTNDKKILFASIMIANTSFTLTEAKACIFFERQWSSIVHEQAKGRIYRLGQDKEVRYYLMNYNNSMDGLQLQALEAKLEITNSLLKHTAFEREDWSSMFNGNYDQQKTLLTKLQHSAQKQQVDL